MANAKLILLVLFSFAAGTCAQSYLPSFAHLNHLGPGGHARGGGEQAEARAKRGAAQLEDINMADQHRLKRETGPLRRPRLTRQTSVRLDDINVNVNAVDNSHHGTDGPHSGEEAERLKRQADGLRHLEIVGEFGGKLKIGFCGDGNGGDSDQDDRLKRQALNGFEDINSDVHADDNWVYA